MSNSDDESTGLPERSVGRMRPSGLFDDALRNSALTEYGQDGAWLIMSIVSYSWRSYFDVAVAAVSGRRPDQDPSRPIGYDDDFQVVLDLHVQGLVFAATEQLATLITAARAHQSDSTSFFDTFTSPDLGSVGELVRGIQDLNLDEVERLAGVPASEADLPPRPSRPSPGPLIPPTCVSLTSAACSSLSPRWQNGFEGAFSRMLVGPHRVSASPSASSSR